jgi:hypothetical protein
MKNVKAGSMTKAKSTRARVESSVQMIEPDDLGMIDCSSPDTATISRESLMRPGPVVLTYPGGDQKLGRFGGMVWGGVQSQSDGLEWKQTSAQAVGRLRSD